MVEIKVGLTYIGKVNGAVFEVVKIEKGHRGGAFATLKDCKAEKIFQYGLEALKRCDIQILKK